MFTETPSFRSRPSHIDDRPLKGAELLSIWRQLSPAARPRFEDSLDDDALARLRGYQGRPPADAHRRRVPLSPAELHTLWTALHPSWRYGFQIALAERVFNRLAAHQLQQRQAGREAARKEETVTNAPDQFEYLTDAGTARQAIDSLSRLAFEVDATRHPDELGRGGALLRGQGVRLSVVFDERAGVGLITLQAPAPLVSLAQRWLAYVAQLTNGRLDPPSAADVAIRVAQAGMSPYERRQALAEQFAMLSGVPTAEQRRLFGQRLDGGDLDGAAQLVSRAQVRSLRRQRQAFH